MLLSVAPLREVDNMLLVQSRCGSNGGALTFGATAGDLFYLSGTAGAGTSEVVVAAQRVEWG